MLVNIIASEPIGAPLDGLVPGFAEIFKTLASFPTGPDVVPVLKLNDTIPNNNRFKLRFCVSVSSNGGCSFPAEVTGKLTDVEILSAPLDVPGVAVPGLAGWGRGLMVIALLMTGLLARPAAYFRR